jgi:hypothetical protein
MELFDEKTGSQKSHDRVTLNIFRIPWLLTADAFKVFLKNYLKVAGNVSIKPEMCIKGISSYSRKKFSEFFLEQTRNAVQTRNHFPLRTGKSWRGSFENFSTA